MHFEPISVKLIEDDLDIFSKKLGLSFRETGFAVLEDHPISTALIEQVKSDACAFFKLSEADKEVYHDAAGGRQRGYTPFFTEHAKDAAHADAKEFWQTGRDLPPESHYRSSMKDTPCVSEIETFDQSVRDLYQAFDALGADVMRGIANFLGLEKTWFSDKIEMGNSVLRLLHYPPQITPPPAGSVRAGAHEDINLITLLLGADEGGLEVLHRSGEWLPISPPPGSMVVNCGDMLDRQTAGYLPSTTHRVVNPDPDRARFSRYSMPFFLHFNQDVVISQMTEFVGSEAAPLPPITAEDFLAERLADIGLLD